MSSRVCLIIYDLPVYISSCLFSLMWSGLLVIPGVSCLWVLPCPAVMSLLNIIIWVYILVCVFLFLPRVCTVTIPQILELTNYQRGILCWASGAERMSERSGIFRKTLSALKEIWSLLPAVCSACNMHFFGHQVLILFWTHLPCFFSIRSVCMPGLFCSAAFWLVRIAGGWGGAQKKIEL